MEGSRLRDALALAGELLRRAVAQLARSPGLAIVSLLLGIALWVLVTDEENPTRIDFIAAPVPLEAANVSPDLAVANTLPSLQVRVAAPAERWDELSASNFRAYVDLNGLKASEQEVPVRVEVVGVNRVRVLDTVPSSVSVTIEELSTKTVSVTPRVVGTLPRGYELGSTVPDRSTADVTGPKSLVSLVHQAAATVNVAGLTVGLDQTVPLTAVAEGGAEIRGVTVNPQNASVNVTVRQDSLARTLPLDVELTGQPAPGYRVTGVRVTPNSVRVEGPIDVLQGIDTLRLPRVDVSGQQADMRATVRLTPPEGMVTAVTSAQVDVTIAPIAGSISLTVAPEVTNVRSGFVARVTPGSVAVVLEGPLPRLNALPAGAVRATVDGAALNVGSTDARLLVTVPEGVTMREVQPAIVSVNVSRS
jgi:YbbR domain-containing protein